MYAAALSILILALGAGSVFSQPAAIYPAQAAPRKQGAPVSKPISGGSTVSPSGAISGGKVKKPAKISKQKSATRKRVKKS